MQSQSQFSVALRQARKGAGLSQTQLSEKSGVSRRTLIRWEQGSASPWIPELQAVIPALELSENEASFLIKQLDSSRSKRTYDHNQKEMVLLLKIARLRSGRTMESVAKDLLCDASTIRRWESGQYFPSARQLKELAKSLGILQVELDLVQSDGYPEITSEAQFRTAIYELSNFHDKYSAALLDARYVIHFHRAELRSNPKWKAHLIVEYAAMLASFGRYSECAECSRMALKLADANPTLGDTTSIRATISLAWGCIGSSRSRGPKVSIKYLDQLDRRPLDWHLLSLRWDAYAAAYTALGDFDRALAYSDRSLSAASHLKSKLSMSLSFNRALIFLKQGLPSDALQAIKGISEASPLQSVQEFRILADIHDQLGLVVESQHWEKLATQISEQFSIPASVIGRAQWIHALKS